LRYASANWHQLILIAVVVFVIAAAAIAWRLGRAKDPTEIERERRAYLNRIGRIVDGQVLEIVERPAEEAGRSNPANHKLLLYAYSISGVSYEAAQDITGLEERACLDRVVAGQPAGVKYDPSNPSNSILIADDWSGLH
jgi:type II secretory pathway pseudopilin PulG